MSEEVVLQPDQLSVDEEGRVVIANPKAASLIEGILSEVAEGGLEEGANVELIHNGLGCACVG